MRFLAADQRELFLPLLDGIHETPPWGIFLRNLAARTNAGQAFLLMLPAGSPAGGEPLVLHHTGPRTKQEPCLTIEQLSGLGLRAYGQMRPGRIYSLDEMLDYDRPDQLARQRAILAESQLHDGRWLRINAPSAGDVWLILLRERDEFSATDSATLNTIAPHFTAALRTYGALAAQRLQTELARSSLARIGVAQLAFDASARVIAADPEAERLLSFTAEPDGAGGRRLQLPPDFSRQLEAHWAPDCDWYRAGTGRRSGCLSGPAALSWTVRRA